MNKKRLVLAAVLAAVVAGLAIYVGKPVILIALLGPAIIVADVLRRAPQEDAAADEAAPPAPVKENVLILGTGMIAVRFLAEIAADEDGPYTVSAFIDETGTHARNVINGVHVCGSLSELPVIAAETEAKALLIAARLDSDRFAAAANMARASGLSVYALPEEKRNSLNAGYRDLILFDN